jgi:hypothetical protein
MKSGPGWNSFRFRAMTSGTSGGDRGHELAVLGMDHYVPNARLCKAMLDRLVAGSILVTFTNARALGASTAVFAT